MSTSWQWAKANPDAAARQIRELERANAYLHDTLDAVIAADERAVDLWRAAHPVNELVIPDRGRLVGWLLEQNAALRKAKEMVELERCEMMRSMSLAQNQSQQLRADKERLDWVIKDSYYHFFFKLSSDLEKGRRQIDAARKEAKP